MSRADEIVVVAYDLQWPSAFRALAAPMRATLGAVALRIDHIGSTSVPGLAAKPIVDIQISVWALEPTSPFRAPLEGLGYVFRADNPELTKRYFREPAGNPRVHIHVRRAGSFGEQFALLFRDFLRAHPAECERYATLKYSLARQHRDDRAAYTDAKEPFIWELMRRANAWSQDVGWEAGPTDA